jgi:mono/diheme cytochrome c family protein
MKLTLLLSIVLLTGCMTYKPLTPTQADVARAQALYPSLHLDQLNEGKVLYETKCSDCHGLKNPAKRTPEQWQKIVPNMAAKANKKNPGQITPQQSEAIIQFLVTMSQTEKP